MSKKKIRRKQNAGMVSVSVIVIAFLLIMAVQIVRLKQKDDTYAAQQQDLQAQMEAENQRAEELDDLDAYTKSQEYIEDTAKSKLGLAYENEIIFKESRD